MRFLLYFFMIPVFCLGQINTGNFELNGNFSGFSDGTIIYLVSLGKEPYLDSSVVRNGKIDFKGEVIEPTVYRVFTEYGAYRNLWLENTTITILGDSADFEHSVISGSIINTQSKQIDSRINPLYEKRRRLFELAMAEKDKDKQRRIRKRMDALDDSTDNLRIGNLFSLNPTFPLMQELYLLRNKLSKDSLNLAFKRFPAKIKKGANGQFIQRFLQTVPITIGMEAPDVSARNDEGVLIDLKDFKGKVVLLDFWAAWCGPCRQNNKQMIKLYRKFKKKGFEIVSFNLDTRKQIWLNASKEDSIEWVNISDLQGMYSQQANQYRIQAIPSAFLIDKQGHITDIIKGFSTSHQDELEQKVSTLLKD